MEFLHSQSLSGGSQGASTLKIVDVDEVKDGVIILRNGSIRAILLISSVNFDLKSSEEQDAIIMQYQNFLNSLDFPLHILISSRKLNIDPYLDFVREKEKEQTNELLRLQISEYQNYIRNLTEISNIMSKFFYIIVPFSPVESKEGGILNKIMAVASPKQVVTEKREQFDTYKNQLWQRVDHVIAGLGQSGIKAVPLKTEEVIELLYNSYNPSLFTRTVIKEVEKMEIN